MKSIPTAGLKAMPSRRAVLHAAAGLCAVFLTTPAHAAEENGDFLFVQTARSMTYDAELKQLTLVGISPITLFFSDRPERVAGNMTTEHFVPFWSTGRDSFLSDPPNADLSILEGGVLRQVVVVLEDPILDSETLKYTVRILDGDMPTSADNVSVFIDVIGMPLTPVSFAGASRRAFRRGAMLR